MIDGNGELVHRALSTILVHPDGRLERPGSRRYTTSYHPTAQPRRSSIRRSASKTPRNVDPTSTSSRNIQTVKASREHVADVQLEFLSRSFNGLLAQADASIMASEEEVASGAQGAEGRLRKAELAKTTQMLTRDRRIAQARQGRVVHRGPVRLLGLAQLAPPAVVGSAASHP